MNPDRSLKLTILTPVLNGENTVERCIRNVAEQDVVSEHIIVDGGSTDRTQQIVNSLMPSLPNLKLVSRTGAGQAAALNIGLEHAQGDLLGVLNVDDLYFPGVFSLVTNHFDDLPSPTLLIGRCKVSRLDQTMAHINRPKNFRYPVCLLGHHLVPFPVNPVAYFYNRELHRLIGGFDEDDPFTMDLDFLLRAIRIAQVVYVDDTLGEFILHPESKTYAVQKENRVQASLDRVYTKHQAGLSPFPRVIVKSLYRLFRLKFFSALAYFANYPEELGVRLRLRLGLNRSSNQVSDG